MQGSFTFGIRSLDRLVEPDRDAAPLARAVVGGNQRGGGKGENGNQAAMNPGREELYDDKEIIGMVTNCIPWKRVLKLPNKWWGMMDFTNDFGLNSQNI